MRAGRPNWVNEDIDEICAAILNLENIGEARAFLGDLLTVKEFNEISNRWKVARMLYAGLKWSRVERLSGVSSATIAKVHRNINSVNGGYKLMFEKLTKTR